jgi:hypothetical protein
VDILTAVSVNEHLVDDKYNFEDVRDRRVLIDVCIRGAVASNFKSSC